MLKVFKKNAFKLFNFIYLLANQVSFFLYSVLLREGNEGGKKL